MDPPYWRRKLYRYNFTDEDFVQLEQSLHKIRGRFLLSLDDHPEVRKLFRGWRITPIEIVYTANRRPVDQPVPAERRDEDHTVSLLYTAFKGTYGRLQALEACGITRE
jgi:hypothetical protein